MQENELAVRIKALDDLKEEDDLEDLDDIEKGASISLVMRPWLDRCPLAFRFWLLGLLFQVSFNGWDLIFEISYLKDDPIEIWRTQVYTSGSI
ncbi:hypothetical protein RHMOL_Rhmol06G0135000 [Rhododendron molle]|uniref:Uncharacterized protein n=1 Tax=Rhododendron molle TaxID=49168 RepID=A0ACC0NC82_RHOML|nr:hypothetical protein RHMOL_Rhmol06G0135000 [Rhododendron molle]